MFQPRPGSTEAKQAQIVKEQEQERARIIEEKRRERIETRRFWITFAVALVAALAALGTLVLQAIQLIAY